MKTLQELHKECGETFKKELVDIDGRTFACEIWDVMTMGEDGCENCIGENFNQMIHRIADEWFDNYKPSGESIDFYMQTYIFWLYLFYERMEFLFNEIDPTKSFLPVQELNRSLKTMNQIRLWANFIKHPKYYFFVHWPKYIFEGQIFDKKSDTIIINTSFLSDHYSSEKQEMPKKLENKCNVVVQFPKLDLLTIGFCKDFKEFIRFICDNSMVIKQLKKKSNIKAATAD